ncbi:hypothetical protein SAY87_027952 [Trapa incisa]|uniref:Purple acid phosphatase n=1 Tax=Trapa incisa TaxID=236973 RepID=A0AAN7KNL6_9MYRT|nr:hypothetical protein SAY87_027952 [Trapa incisa]
MGVSRACPDRRLTVAMAILAVTIAGMFAGGHSYSRPKARRNIFVRHIKANSEDNSPEQVHISLLGKESMKVSWITESEAPATVEYGTSAGVYNRSSTGTTSSYRYMIYRSGQIHEAVMGPLEANTNYHYRLSSDPSRDFTFKTPPAEFPIKFAVVGDFGQTEWTKSTLEHVSRSKYDVLLLPGDLSYANYIQPRWDTFGRLVEPLASQRPWMVTQGNHEVEAIPVLHSERFTAYNARWRMPFEESGSDSNLYYSFDVAGVHVIMLGSYTDFDPGYMEPKKAISIFREASFGHGQLEVPNATHARWLWHRNDNDEAVVADSVWLTSLSSNPRCKN